MNKKKYLINKLYKSLSKTFKDNIIDKIKKEGINEFNYI